jgi:transcription antitermination factor NusG
MQDWYAVYTKPRWEKKVKSLLEKSNITSYLPTQKLLKQYADRKKKVEALVLPSYIFVQIAKEQITEVRMVAGVINFVYWQQKPCIIKPSDMQDFQAFMALDGEVVFEKIEHQIGDVIEISTPPFVGQKAKIASKTTKRMELILESLQIKLIIDLKK